MAKRASDLLKLMKSEYGGDLLTTRRSRSQGRPLDTQNSMHLVLRSSKARGSWSFMIDKNRFLIREIVLKFAKKYDVRVLSIANVSNHLHMQIHLNDRLSYSPFIRAITAAIAMAMTGRNRWNPGSGEKLKFWDRRPFTRIILGFKGILSLKNYVRLNHFEGIGVIRHQTRKMLSFKATLKGQRRRFVFPETS